MNIKGQVLLRSMNPLELFFKLGDKVTKGDIKRKTNFDYYMLWVMFLAFFTLFISYFVRFINSNNISQLAWAFVMLAILWFQYSGLKSVYEIRKMLNQNIPDKIISEKEMLKEFENFEEKNKENFNKEIEEMKKD